MAVSKLLVTIKTDDKVIELIEICGLIAELRDMATDQAKAKKITDEISERFGEIICTKC